MGAVFWMALLNPVIGGRRQLWVTSLCAADTVCGYWDLAVVIVCHVCVVFRVFHVCLLFECDVAPACCVKKGEGRHIG